MYGGEQNRRRRMRTDENRTRGRSLHARKKEKQEELWIIASEVIVGKGPIMYRGR
jgi:hypothetical protein